MKASEKNGSWRQARQAGLLVLAFALQCSLAQADWTLVDEESSVQFVSVKNAAIAEVHHFAGMRGGIDAEGAAKVTIDLDSVETLIPIRNERMRKMLFETVQFPSATLSVDVPDDLAALAAGETTEIQVPVNVELHGKSKNYPTRLKATRLVDGALEVAVLEPLVVYAADFDLAGGVAALQKIAGLNSISTAVPVTARLTFRPE